MTWLVSPACNGYPSCIISKWYPLCYGRSSEASYEKVNQSTRKMNHQEHYKRKPAGFHDANDGRVIRAGRHEERRRDNRAQHFARHRDVSGDAEEVRTTRRSDLNARLRRWKEERALKKKIEQQKKKPVFKVGVVHHNFFSPPVNDRYTTRTQSCMPKKGRNAKSHQTPPKRITRATQKRIDARNVAKALTPAVASRSNISPKPGRSERKRHPSVHNSRTKSFAPPNHVFTAPTGINEIPMFGRIAVLDINSFTFNLPTADKEPLSTVDNSLNDVGQSKIMKDRLQRRNAVEEPLSPTSLAATSDQNSSTDFCLRLSADDDSTEETPEHNPPLTEDIVAKITTPPRSGTPVPASFSPYIVTSRGKNSARKEQKDRMGIRRSSANEIPTKDTVMQSLNISVEEEEQTANYFKFLMLRETDRLNGLCTKWDILRTDPTLSEDAASQIVAAIGQTQLLIRKKFERFRSLIHDCETGKGQMLVRCKDLGGFWDLIDREIKDCDARFLKLEFLEANNWVEEEAVVTKVTKKKAAPAKTKAKLNAKSSARSWILAARKKMIAQDTGLDNDLIATPGFAEEVPSTSRMSETPKEPERKRRTTSTPKTPMSLLKTVHLSASKNVRSPLAVMKVSKMFKTPEVTMDDTISYVNSDQTPAKGILKKSEESSGSGSIPPKSSRKVDFNDDVFLEEFPSAEVDEALQNSIDLGRALARIDSYDSESNFDSMRNVTVRTAERCLDFEDESFDEADDTHTAESATIVAATPEPTIIPHVVVLEPTPLKTTTKQTPSKKDRRSSRRSSNVFEEHVDEIEEPSTRVLRNRMIVVETPNNGNRRSQRLSVLDETNSRSTKASTKENVDPQRGTEKEIASELHNVLGTDQDNEDNTRRRRSTRKSVRFNPDDCMACGEAPKPVQPTTPSARRSRKVSLLGDQLSASVEPLIGGDLMSFDTPAKIPPRIQRSSRK